MSPIPPPNRNRCLLGGTFDRMHVGHEKLITTCLKRCDYLEIWLTTDEMVSEKIGNVQSFETFSEKIWNKTIEVNLST